MYLSLTGRPMATITQSDGIQQLLAAEKRAAERVKEARNNKARRLKQAKQEAQAEIEQYRKEQEKTSKEREKDILGSKSDTERQIQERMKFALQELNQKVVNNKERALTRLLDLVCDIRPDLHVNYGNL